MLATLLHFLKDTYTDINIQAALSDKASIFYHYKKLVDLRKRMDVIVYGEFELILSEHSSVFAYTRSLDQKILLVVNNVTSESTTVILPETLITDIATLLISNYEDSELKHLITLRPYESFTFQV